MDEQVDNLHAQIISYLGRINRGELSDEHTRELINLMAAANDLKHIGDLIQSDLVDLGVKRFNAGITVSEHSHGAFLQLGEEVSNTLADAVKAVAENDNLIASEVIRKKERINLLVDSAAMHEAQCFSAEEPNRLLAYTIEVAVIDKLKRIYYYAKRMAKTLPTPVSKETEIGYGIPRPVLGEVYIRLAEGQN